MAEETSKPKPYALKPGFTHYRFIRGKVDPDTKEERPGQHVRCKEGEIVELTELQAKSFADRFESPEASKRRAAEVKAANEAAKKEAQKGKGSK